MLITPSDIEKKTFSPQRKYGYNTQEVDDYLDLISGGISELFQKIADQEALLESTKQQIEELQTQNTQLKRSVDSGRTQGYEQQAWRTPTIVNQTPSGAASLSEGFSSTIEAIIRIDATALSDADRLLSYFADLAPQMQAEHTLLRIANQLGAIKALSADNYSEWGKARAKDILISGFIEPNIANELVETLASYALGTRTSRWIIH